MNEQQLSLEDVETLSNISEIERTTTTVKEKIKFAEPMKKCTKCGELKPINEFNRHVGHREGLQSRCRICQRDSQREFYNNNRERVLIRQKTYRSNHRDPISERKRIYHQENRERDLERSRNHYINNLERYRGRFKEFNFLRGHSSRTNGFLRGNGICLICGEYHPLTLENHHVIPNNDFTISLCANCHRKFRSTEERHMIGILNAIENSKFLWSDFDEEDIWIDFNPKIGEESPLVEVLVR